MIPPVTYFGGKGLLKSRILPLIPQTQIYAELFGGAGSILFAKSPAPVEIYNDLDQDLVNLFRTIQDPSHFADFVHKLEYTLYSRPEFDRAIAILADDTSSPVDRAWATYVRQNQGFSGLPQSKTWGRAIRSSSRGMASTTSKWQTRLQLFDQWHSRLARVQIECRPALRLLGDIDEPETTVYLDPPYPASTRKSGGYRHEMTDDDHAALAEAMIKFRGNIVLSTYDSPIYAPLAQHGFETHQFETYCHIANKTRTTVKNGASPRTEILYTRIKT